jgi:uncharacterized protein (DUF1778 family)
MMCGDLPYITVESRGLERRTDLVTTKSDARVDFRLTQQAKAVIEEAAALAGQSLSDFAVSTLLEKANQVLNAKRHRSLSERDARTFLKLLDSAPKPNQALREAAAWYKADHA